MTLVAIGDELRCLHDYQGLLEAAGFEFRKLHSLSTWTLMIEAVCP